MAGISQHNAGLDGVVSSHASRLDRPKMVFRGCQTRPDGADVDLGRPLPARARESRQRGRSVRLCIAQRPLGDIDRATRFTRHLGVALDRAPTLLRPLPSLGQILDCRAQLPAQRGFVR